MMNGRLKPGITRKQAEVTLNVIKKRLDDTYRKDEKRHDALTLQTAGGLIAGSATPAFTLMAVLMVVVGLVLLVACANVANLLLARAIGRQKEIAIRLAMGAKRRQLIRQLLFESFLLALTGAGVGFLLAAGAARAISNFQLPLPFPVVFDFNVDMRVALFTLGLSIVTALLFGLVPAMRASRPDLVGCVERRPCNVWAGGAFAAAEYAGCGAGGAVARVACDCGIVPAEPGQRLVYRHRFQDRQRADDDDGSKTAKLLA